MFVTFSARGLLGSVNVLTGMKDCLCTILRTGGLYHPQDWRTVSSSGLEDCTILRTGGLYHPQDWRTVSSSGLEDRIILRTGGLYHPQDWGTVSSSGLEDCTILRTGGLYHPQDWRTDCIILRAGGLYHPQGWRTVSSSGLEDCLGVYTADLVAQGVTGLRLLQLAPDLLPGLGVLKVGHQELLLQSVAQLRHIVSAPAAAQLMIASASYFERKNLKFLK